MRFRCGDAIQMRLRDDYLASMAFCDNWLISHAIHEDCQVSMRLRDDYLASMAFCDNWLISHAIQMRRCDSDAVA
jgi:hypothetical protein